MQQQPPPNLPQTLPPPSSGLAVATLILGITSFLFWIVASIPAIICGHIALHRIKKAGYQITGRGMALAGTICGYCSLLLSILITSIIIAGPVMAHKKAEANAELDRKHAIQLHTLLKKYESDHGTFPPTLGDLVTVKYTSSINHLQPQRGGNWHYYIGQSSKDDANNLLLLAPESDIALFIDGSTDQLKSYSSYMHAKSRMRDHQSTQQ